jgi:oligogalacturonide lyase
MIDTIDRDDMKPSRQTHFPQANEQLLYFTSSSLWSDGRHLVFLSDRSGHPNIYLRDLDSGDETALSHNSEGYLKSYVYFDGSPYQGLGKASVSLDPNTGEVYYLQGQQIVRADNFGAVRVLAELPVGQMTAFTHVSADGKRLCVPTTDARALDGGQKLEGKPAYNIDARIQAENLCSYLWVFDTSSGAVLLHEPVQRSWITHVQFSPLDSEQILYNHEWPGDCGIRRMWLFNNRKKDGNRHLCLRTEGQNRSRHDWTCHEMWERDGQGIIYHGQYVNGRSYLGRVNPDGSDPREVLLPAGWDAYGHFTVGQPGELVTDGYYQPGEDDKDRNGQWISRLKVDWDRGLTQWKPLCRHGSSWDSQDSHPHPILDQAGERVFFTSDFEGKRAVYSV